MMKASVAGLALAVLMGGAAAAQDSGFVTTNVNLRAGPSTGYPVVTVLLAGTPLEIFGCLDEYTWCDVDWRGYRGWVSANYLEYDYRGRRVLVPEYAPQVGVPIISFQFNDYWGRYYRGRPWYSGYDRWGPPPRPYRPPPAYRPPPGSPSYGRPGWGPPPGPRPAGPGWNGPGPGRDFDWRDSRPRDRDRDRDRDRGDYRRPQQPDGQRPPREQGGRPPQREQGPPPREQAQPRPPRGEQAAPQPSRELSPIRPPRDW